MSKCQMSMSKLRERLTRIAVKSPRYENRYYDDLTESTLLRLRHQFTLFPFVNNRINVLFFVVVVVFAVDVQMDGRLHDSTPRCTLVVGRAARRRRVVAFQHVSSSAVQRQRRSALERCDDLRWYGARTSGVGTVAAAARTTATLSAAVTVDAG